MSAEPYHLPNIRIFPIKTKTLITISFVFIYYTTENYMLPSFLFSKIFPVIRFLFEIYMEMNYVKWVLVRIFQLSSIPSGTKKRRKKSQEQETLVYFIVKFIYATTHKLRIYLHTISLRKHFADCVVVEKKKIIENWLGFSVSLLYARNIHNTHIFYTHKPTV